MSTAMSRRVTALDIVCHQMGFDCAAIERRAPTMKFGEVVRKLHALNESGLMSLALCRKDLKGQRARFARVYMALRTRLGEIYEMAATFVGWAPLPIRPTLHHAQQLLDEIEHKGRYHCSGLSHAISHGDADYIRGALELGADPNVRETDEVESTPLHKACRWVGGEDVAQLLIDGGADIDATNGLGATPLAVAASNGREDIVSSLLAAGANVNVRLPGGFTSLHLAAFQGRESTVGLLVLAGASVNAQDLSGTTPLIMSVNDEGILDFLLAEGANINFQGPTGRTALMWASAHGFEDSVRRLLHGRANITLKDDAGQTALSLARAGGHEATAQLLRDAGATE